MKELHSLLRRQLRKVFGEEFTAPADMQDFISAVNKAYQEFDSDRNMLERSLELSSQELLQTNSELRAIFETLPDLFFRLDRQGTILDCKTGNTLDLVVPRKVLVGKRIYDFPLKDVGGLFFDAIEQVDRTRCNVSIEYALTLGKEEKYYEARFLPLLDDQIIVIIRNVTERKRAEKILKLREAKLEKQNLVLSELIKNDRLFLGDISEAISEITKASALTLDVDYASVWLINEDGTKLVCTSLFQKSSHKNPSQLPELDIASYPAYMKALEEERAIMAHDAQKDPRTKDLYNDYLEPFNVASLLDAPIRKSGRIKGTLCNEQISAQREWTLEEHNFTASMADLLSLVFEVAEHRRKDEQLRLTQFSVDHSDIATFWLDMKGHVLRVNKAACESLGYTEEELLHMTVYDFDIDFSIDKSLQYRTELKEKRTTTTLSRQVRKDGSIFPVEITITKLEYGGNRYFFSFVRDITERLAVEDEKNKLQAQLLHAQKMEAIGTLAGGIAHDFNNILMGIQGYASLMRYGLDQNSPHYDKLLQVEDLVRSGADLTRQLLGFARGGRYEVHPADINSILKKTASMFARTRKEIVLHEHYGDIVPADVDQGQMEQIFLNLYVNAWQAMPGGGDLYIETGTVVLDESYSKPYSVKPGTYVKISITDTGTGMDEKTRERIFEPFFTTKEMGRGTGLGLASVYGIIKNHDGIINVYSEKGHGTTFTVYLPASEKEIVVEEKPQVQIRTGTETILLVDDQDTVTKVGTEILRALGYKVYSAQSGHEALNIYAEMKNQIDLVLLDMIMPTMSGGKTFDHLHAINPDVRVILSSGYSLNGEAKRIMKKGIRGFIQKPFDVTQLSNKIREVLDEQG